MRKRLLSLLLVFVLVLGMLPASAFAADLPFSIDVDGETATVTDGSTVVCSYCEDEMDAYTIDITGKEELTFTFTGECADDCLVTLWSPDADWDGFEDYEDIYPEDGAVTLSLPVNCSYLCVQESETGEFYHFLLADNSPKFKAFVDGEEISAVETDTIKGKPSYLLTVPAGTTEVDFEFLTGAKDYHFYNKEGTFLGTGDTSGQESYTIPVQDAYMIGSNGMGTSGSDGVLDGVAIQKAGEFTAEYYIMFAYAAADEGGEETDAPFLSIKIGDEEIAEDKIQLIHEAYEMGGDSWDLVHVVPYYHVTVPCGTTSVDVTYHEEPVICTNEPTSDVAYGYGTVVEGVDATSSATVRPISPVGDYVKNNDNTQTVSMPVAQYVVDADGYGKAITVEEDGGNYLAMCLFSFKYEEGTHSFGDAATCSVCGAANPDYVEPGVEIPEGAPFTALTTDAGDVGAITQMDDAATANYGSVPYYHVQIPASATKVYVTHPASEDPFCDASYGSAYGYAANTDDWSTSGVSLAFEAVEDGYKIELPVQLTFDDWMTGSEVSYDFVADEDGYVGYAVAVERSSSSSFTPICFFTFEYAEAEAGEHVHSYDEGVVTTQPGCMTKGEKTFTCSGCDENTEGHSYTEDIPANGHKHGALVETTPATCMADGEKTAECPNCDADTEGHIKTEKITKLGHQYNEGEVTTKATCEADGEKLFTCTREGCTEETKDHTKTEKITKLGHNFANGKCQNEGCEETCPLQDENGVFLLSNYDELLWFANAVNGGQTTISGKLTADITVPENWPGIGKKLSDGSTHCFAGTFDGDGHTVTLSGSVWGLFAYVMGTYDSNYSVKEYAVVKNVITDGISKDAPLIHAAGYAKISNCINKADTTGDNGYIAGIVGSLKYALKYNSLKYCDLRIENCINEGDIRGTSYVGGIVGEAVSGMVITGCVNTGNISGTGKIGGIAGHIQKTQNAVKIENSYNSGAVSGSTSVGGLVGDLYNGVQINNCYNAGEATYAIAGGVYNNTASVTNVYYRADLSGYAAPEKYSGGGYNTTVYSEAMNSADMGSADFAAKLGSAFKESCGGPVLSWQEAKAHTEANGGCSVCHAGFTEDTTLTVHKSTGDGYEIVGYDTVTKGNAYTFTVDIQDGYETENLAVYYNGTALTAEDGKYTIKNPAPTGHFYITVTGVKEMPDVRPISLPKEGNGYRVVPCEGYTTTVSNGGEFKFTVQIMDGFKKGDAFEVHVNNEKIDPDESGVYTVSNITEKKTVTVHDVVTASTASVTIDVHITDGKTAFFEAKNINKTLMIDQSVTVPYFDLELYGMDKYYYNPYCYEDEDGNPVPQTAGTREDANGVVTVMHAFIYMTDMFYLGLDEEYAGTGYSKTKDTDEDGTSDFDEAIYWGEQSVGSTFVNNFWGHPNGGNLNYHVNYKYPLGRDGWGSTSDQIRLYANDVLTIHFIGDSANGSAFGFFAVNDTDNTYDGTEQKDRAEVKAGEAITLTNYIASQGKNYTTAFITGDNKELYWVNVDVDAVSRVIREADPEEGIESSWRRDGFGNMTAEEFKTDANGVVTLNTTGMEPGVYYIANHGQFYKGDGSADSAGFVSNGAEAGPSYFVLTITEGDAVEITYGDMNNDGEVLLNDAAMVYAIANSKLDATEEQLAAADVDGNGEVLLNDAAMVYAYANSKLEKFPVEEN